MKRKELRDVAKLKKMQTGAILDRKLENYKKMKVFDDCWFPPKKIG